MFFFLFVCLFVLTCHQKSKKQLNIILYFVMLAVIVPPAVFNT